MTTLTREQLAGLAEPFGADVIQWKPGATNRDKTSALALAYVDSRAYFDRLDAVVPGDWSDDYQVNGDGTIVTCRLTIAGVTRCDVGEKDAGDNNTTTSAAAQAFKRACAKFGLGRHLYRMPQVWADYDAQRRRFTDQALVMLHNTAAGQVKTAPETPAVRRNAPRSTGNGRNGAHKPTPAAPSDPAFDELPGHERSAYQPAPEVPTFRTPAEAQAWAMGQGVFDHRKHCVNAYDKLRRDVIAKAGDELPTAAEFFGLWVADVERRKAETQAAVDEAAPF